jgi:hypothetical protein
MLHVLKYNSFQVFIFVWEVCRFKCTPPISFSDLVLTQMVSYALHGTVIKHITFFDYGTRYEGSRGTTPTIISCTQEAGGCSASKPETAQGTQWIGVWSPEPAQKHWKSENLLSSGNRDSDPSVFQPIASTLYWTNYYGFYTRYSNIIKINKKINEYLELRTIKCNSRLCCP